MRPRNPQLLGKGLIRDRAILHELGKRHSENVPYRHGASQAPCADLGTELSAAIRHTLGMAKTNFIKEWRKAADLSQQLLAEKATEIAAHLPRPDDQKEAPSWGRTDVNKYENGKREPPMPFYRAAAAILGCSVDDLIGREPRDPKPLPDDLKEVGPAWRSVQEEDRERALNVLRQFSR